MHNNNRALCVFGDHHHVSLNEGKTIVYTLSVDNQSQNNIKARNNAGYEHESKVI